MAPLERDDLLDVMQKPRIHARRLVDLGDAHPRAERVADGPQAVGVGHAQVMHQRLGGLLAVGHRAQDVEARAPRLQ
jgi:hypothetical protein